MTLIERGMLRVQDGRSVAVCETGDPYGRPALYLHGTGSSRLEAALYDEAATAHGIRLISWDRPGSGMTPYQPGRRLLDIVPDARAVARSVTSGRVPALGLSGGGSHVLALAQGAADFVEVAVALNPGAPATDEVLAASPRQIATLVRIAREQPRVFGVLGKLMESRNPLLQSFKNRAMDPLDVTTLNRPEVKDLFEAAITEGARQPRAYTREALMLWGAPWDVPLRDFPVPLHVFAGENDPFATFSRSLGEDGATVHWFPGGHVSGLAPEVLERVMAVVAGTRAG